MISMEFDEAFLYDILAILKVKLIKTAYSDVTAYDNYQSFTMRLLERCPKHQAILKSTEFSDLVFANLAIFERIDEMKKKTPTGEDAIFIDSMNYKRFLYKKALQEKFFPNEKLTEQKFGYDKNNTISQ